MRRNLRLDWRALALLGALLSIIIDWPGLVYAMPTILPPVAAIAAEAAPIDTLNIIKNDKMLSFFPAEHNKYPVAGSHPQHKDSQMKNELADSENLNSFSTTSTPSMSPTPTMSSYNTELALETERQPQQRLTTINEKQQFNDNNNSISDNKTNNKKQKEQNEITAIHKTQQNSLDEATESAAVQKVSLLNTHTKNSAINTISLSKSITTQPTITTTTSTPPFSTTESSAKIQSTLMPTTSADQSDDGRQQPLSNSHLNTENLINNFKFSSSHHLAILSRTERSVRSPTSSSSASSANVSSWGMPLISSGSSRRGSSNAGGVAGALLVRRSSDMSVLKSKRLNNSRNLHHRNNLDRNERSTVSHLSGPSRKIQLYIKNRFIQLLPDGTVNGTQDEQCDYIRDDNDDLHDKTFQLHLHQKQQQRYNQRKR